jgi:hypothetical protein
MIQYAIKKLKLIFNVKNDGKKKTGFTITME